MPALVDYAGRYEAAREAMLALVLKEGPGALTLPRVAAEMNVSLSTIKRLITRAEALPRTALAYVHREQRGQLLRPVRWAIRPEDPPWEQPLRRLRWHVPVDREDIDVVRAWAALTTGLRDSLPDVQGCIDDRAALLGYAVRELLDALPLPGDRAQLELGLAALVDGLRDGVQEGRCDGLAARAVLDAVAAALSRL